MSSRPPRWFDKNPLAQATTLPLPPFFGPLEHPGYRGDVQLSEARFPVALGMCIFGHGLLIVTWDLWVLLESN